MGLAHKTTVWKGPWCATRWFLTLLRSKGQVSITTAVLHTRLCQNNVLLRHGLHWTWWASGDFPQKITVFSHREKQTECEHKPLCPALNPCVEELAFVPSVAPTAFPRPSGELFPAGLGSSPTTQFICTELSVKAHLPLQSETPSQQLPLSITLPGSPDYQEENWSEHLPVLINCVAQVI